MTSQATHSQSAPTAIAEPTSPGIFYLLDPANAQVPLEYGRGQTTFGQFGVQGERSPVRFAADTPFRFVVHLVPGKDGKPLTPVFYQFAVGNGWRNLATEIVDRKLVLKRGTDEAIVPFDSTTFGSGSLVLTPKGPLRPGEYCLGTNAKGPKEAYCFGVDDASGAAAGAQAAPSASSGPAMTNADVIKMVAAGLSADVIAAAVRQASAHNFDLTINGLIDLKKNKVPDAVVVAMQQPSVTSTVATGPATPATASTTKAVAPVDNAKIPMPAEEDVFYYLNAAGKLAKLEYAQSDAVDSQKRLVEGTQVEFKVFGARSPVRFTDGSVALVVKLCSKTFLTPPCELDDVLFRRWESTSGARQTWFTTRKVRRNRQRDPDPGQFEFTATKLGPQFYKITPNDPLVPGEYCVSASYFSKHYCFGVDAPH